MDVSTSLQTWQQAFEDYPISTTRALEKQLRSNITNGKERLRSLVGSNYRELLSTAEQIITLDVQTKDVESRISDLGLRCQPPALQPIAPSKANSSSYVAQLRLLQRCLNEAHGVFAKGELLLAAKLIVIGSVLVKSLGDHEPRLRSLDTLRAKISSTRRKLLRAVEASLSQPASTLDVTLDSCCAYCLITSASSEDVLKHIRYLRLDKLRQSLEHEELSRRQYVEAFRYQLASVLLLKSVSGRQLDDAIGALQKKPILQEDSPLNSELLALAGTKALIPEEIRNFTPYLKKRGLSTDEVAELLENWSSEASNVFAATLEDSVPESWTVSDILSLRNELYSQLLPAYFSLPSRSHIKDALAHAVITHLGRECNKREQQLEKLVKDLVEGLTASAPAGSLWQKEVVMMALSTGAGKLLSQVHNRRSGTNRSLTITTRAIKRWIRDVNDHREQLDALRKIRWRDVVEEPEDDQEDEAKELLTELMKFDPESYLNDLTQATEDGFRDAQNTVLAACSHCLEQQDGAESAVRLLRTIREAIQPLRQAFKEAAKFDKLNDMIPRLYDLVARQILTNTLKSLSGIRGDDRLSALENMPSPNVFQLLQQLCHEMTALGGTDLWSPAAVAAVRTVVAAHVFDEEHGSAMLNTDFDKAYLGAALQYKHDIADSISESKAGREYWTRTKLLFGLLA